MFKKIKNTLIISCVLYFLIGIIMLLFPELVGDSICYLIASLFIFCGVVGVVMYIRNEVKSVYASSSLILSILLGVFGVYIFLNSKVFLSFIPLIAGVFMIIDSVNKLSLSFDLKKYGYQRWWYMFIVSFVVLGLGLLILSDPIKVLNITIRIIGGILIFDAISNIFTIKSFSVVEKTVVTPGLIGDIVVKEEK